MHIMATISLVLNQPQFHGLYTLLFLPPYTPFLNPIENVFSVVKGGVKKYLREHSNQMLSTCGLLWGQKANA